VEDSKLSVPEGKMPIFPILEVRDRLEEGHWVKKVKNFSCPDPEGLVKFRLEMIE
jgi:uncharacterized repeat protein (TIGR04076 family)